MTPEAILNVPDAVPMPKGVNVPVPPRITHDKLHGVIVGDMFRLSQARLDRHGNPFTVKLPRRAVATKEHVGPYTHLKEEPVTVDAVIAEQLKAKVAHCAGKRQLFVATPERKALRIQRISSAG